MRQHSELKSHTRCNHGKKRVQKKQVIVNALLFGAKRTDNSLLRRYCGFSAVYETCMCSMIIFGLGLVIGFLVSEAVNFYSKMRNNQSLPIKRGLK